MSEKISMLTIQLPETLELLLNQVADASKTSKEDILLAWLREPLPHPNQENYEAFMNSLAQYSNVHLWTLVYRLLPEEQEEAYQNLYEKHESGIILTEEELKEWENLAELSNINILIRAQALLLLKERGENIQHFLKRNLLVKR